MKRAREHNGQGCEEEDLQLPSKQVKSSQPQESETIATPEVIVGNEPTNLLEAVSNGDSARVLQLLNLAEVNEKIGDFLECRDAITNATPLIIAARKQFPIIVSILLDKGASVNAVDASNRTALMHATENRVEFAIVDTLIRRGASVTLTDKQGYTALSLAAKNGNADLVELYIRHGASVMPVTLDKHTALSLAAAQGHAAIVEYLLPRAKESIIQHAAMQALENNHATVVDIFMKQPNFDAQVGVRLLVNAAKKGLLEVIHVIVQNGIPPYSETKTRWSALHYAAKEGHLPVVKYLIEREVPICSEAKGGWTPLMLAALDGHVHVVDYLFQHGASVLDTEEESRTALHFAAQEGHLDLVQFLVQQGAAVSHKATGAWTPLILAAENGHLPVVKYLISQGASIDECTPNNTVLMAAAQSGNIELIDYIISLGAQVTTKSESGFLPLHVAAWQGNLELVEHLVKRGAAIKGATTREGWGPLHHALQGGHVAVVEYLLNHGISDCERDHEDFTPLMRAAQVGNLACVKLLTKRGASVNDFENERYRTPLMLVCEQAREESGSGLPVAVIKVSDTELAGMVEHLINHGALVNAQNRESETPLMIASRVGNLEIVKVLTCRGAEIDKLSKGYTALSLAVKKRRIDVVRHLLERGASINTDLLKLTSDKRVRLLLKYYLSWPRLRLLFIGFRDPGSPLSLLPVELLAVISPLFNTHWDD